MAFYLTIDDGPSLRAQEKLDFLSAKGITAIWFLLGQNIEKNKEAAIEAVQRGHILGNHSYSHPHFPLTSVKAIREEIDKTEVLIEEIYKTAGVVRPTKLFRFPYGEQGGFLKRRILHKLLESYGFQTGPFDSVQFGLLFRNKLGDPYWMWSYDTRDWAMNKEGIQHLTFEQISKNLDTYLQSYSPEKDQIILMHDHEPTTHEFCKLIDRFLAHGVSFVPINKLA